MDLMLSDLITMSVEDFLEKHKDNCFNFFDWFCRDTSLKNKSKGLFTKAKKFVRSANVGPMFNFKDEGDYVFFKNNCPCYGDQRLYDSFSICNKDGDVICFIAPRNPYGFVEMSYEGHGFENDTSPLYFNSFNDLCHYVMNPLLFNVKT